VGGVTTGYFRCAEGPDRRSADRLPGILWEGSQLVAALFGQPFGAVAPGMVADLIVMDYVPATPMTATTVAAHILFGMNSGQVEHVMVDGK